MIIPTTINHTHPDDLFQANNFCFSACPVSVQTALPDVLKDDFVLKGLAKHVPRLAHLAERSDAMVTWTTRDWLEEGGGLVWFLFLVRIRDVILCNFWVILWSKCVIIEDFNLEMFCCQLASLKICVAWSWTAEKDILFFCDRTSPFIKLDSLLSLPQHFSAWIISLPLSDIWWGSQTIWAILLPFAVLPRSASTSQSCISVKWIGWECSPQHGKGMPITGVVSYNSLLTQRRILFFKLSMRMWTLDV